MLRPIRKDLWDGMLSGQLACACAWAREPGMDDGAPFLYISDWNSALERRSRVRAPGHGSYSPVATFKLCSYQKLVEVTPACITIMTTHRDIGTVHHHPSLACGVMRMHMHILAASWAYHCTDLSGAGPKRSQYCGPPVTVYTAIGGEES